MSLRVTQPQVAAIILAGGRSRRMGRDKALLPVPGKTELTLLEQLASQLAEVCAELLLVTRDETSGKEYLALPGLEAWRLVHDQDPDQGPLMGLLSGLQATSLSHALVLAVDMPSVEPALLSWLASQPLTDEILIPRIAGIAQVLLARYPCSALSAIQSCLATGRRDLRALLSIAPVHFLEEPELRALDPTLRSFVNLNTPEDYQRIGYS